MCHILGKKNRKRQSKPFTSSIWQLALYVEVASDTALFWHSIHIIVVCSVKHLCKTNSKIPTECHKNVWHGLFSIDITCNTVLKSTGNDAWKEKVKKKSHVLVVINTFIRSHQLSVEKRNKTAVRLTVGLYYTSRVQPEGAYFKLPLPTAPAQPHLILFSCCDCQHSTPELYGILCLPTNKGSRNRASGYLIVWLF